MSKFCVRTAYDEQIKKCLTAYCRLRLTVIQRWTIFQIQLYEVYLWVNHVVRISIFGYRDDDY